MKKDTVSSVIAEYSVLSYIIRSDIVHFITSVNAYLMSDSFWFRVYDSNVLIYKSINFLSSSTV